MWRSWCAVTFALEATKRKPRHLTDVGASALGRSMALRHSERDCSGLLAAFNLFDDDGADDKGDGKASRQKI